MICDGVAPETHPASGLFTRETTARLLRYFWVKTASTVLLVVDTPGGSPMLRGMPESPMLLAGH
jgi:hypothetical protein